MHVPTAEKGHPAVTQDVSLSVKPKKLQVSSVYGFTFPLERKRYLLRP